MDVKLYQGVYQDYFVLRQPTESLRSRHLEAKCGATLLRPLFSFLIESHPLTLRPVALNFGDVQYRMMEQLPESIITGTAAFHAVYGSEFWAWHDAHPTEHAIFDATSKSSIPSSVP